MEVSMALICISEKKTLLLITVVNSQLYSFSTQQTCEISLLMKCLPVIFPLSIKIIYAIIVVTRYTINQYSLLLSLSCSLYVSVSRFYLHFYMFHIFVAKMCLQYFYTYCVSLFSLQYTEQYNIIFLLSFSCTFIVWIYKCILYLI